MFRTDKLLVTQWQKFHNNDGNRCSHNKSGRYGVPNTHYGTPSLQGWQRAQVKLKCLIQYGTSVSESQMFLLVKRPQ